MRRLRATISVHERPRIEARTRAPGQGGKLPEAGKVALKVLRDELASGPERLKRFEQEARAASALDHPNIITIHDIAESDGIHYIVMQYVEGETLRELLREGPLPLETLLEFAS